MIGHSHNADSEVIYDNTDYVMVGFGPTGLDKEMGKVLCNTLF